MLRRFPLRADRGISIGRAPQQTDTYPNERENRWLVGLGYRRLVVEPLRTPGALSHEELASFGGTAVLLLMMVAALPARSSMPGRHRGWRAVEVSLKPRATSDGYPSVRPGRNSNRPQGAEVLINPAQLETSQPGFDWFEAGSWHRLSGSAAFVCDKGPQDALFEVKP